MKCNYTSISAKKIILATKVRTLFRNSLVLVGIFLVFNMMVPGVFLSSQPQYAEAASGDVTEITITGSFGNPKALAFAPGKDFLVSEGLGLFTLTSAGVVTTIGYFGDGTQTALTGLAFSGDTLFAVARGNTVLYTVDPLTGTILDETPILRSDGKPAANVLALGSNPATGELFIILLPGRVLASIDPVTGQASVIGPTGKLINAITVLPDGTVIATVGGGETTDIFELSLSDGSASTFLELELTPLRGAGFAFNTDDCKIYLTNLGHFRAIDIGLTSCDVPPLPDSGGGGDSDGDGFFVDVEPLDCDDNNATIFPGAPEVDNGVDDNCNGATDEGFDLDNDGFTPLFGGDCNDNDNTIFPGATDIPDDGIDQDCDGVDATAPPVETGTDSDGDGFFVDVEPLDCDDNNATIFPGAPELDDGIDNNCNVTIDEGLDVDGDTFTPLFGGDCNDNDNTIFLGAPELLDGLDNDCDGVIPANETDDDSDGVAEYQGDCNDNDPTIFPGATDIPDDEIDQDCDGVDATAPPVETVDIERMLAQDAITEAQALLDAGDFGGKTKKQIQKSIDSANKEMGKAQQFLDQGDPDNAIEKFKKAWEHAQKAIKAATK